jgi:hypothetical protein
MCSAHMEGGPPLRPWLEALKHRDPQFVDSYIAVREHAAALVMGVDAFTS